MKAITAIAISAFFWLGVFGLALWLSPPDPPAPITIAQKAAPVCEAPLAVLDNNDTLVLRRNGLTADLVVMHEGAVRGRLLTINLDARTLNVPERPPFGWSIGGR